VTVRPDDKERREFIMAQLALTVGTTTAALAKKYVAAHPELQLDYEQCKKGIEQLAIELHNKRKLNATPNDDGFFLLPKW